jgi:hypothetical protein
VVRNRRLCQAGYLWALPLLTHSPGARAHYDHRRERGDSYNAAARNLTNRYFGILFHCLQHRISYDEAKAFPTPTTSGGLTATGPDLYHYGVIIDSTGR